MSLYTYPYCLHPSNLQWCAGIRIQLRSVCAQWLPKKKQVTNRWQQLGFFPQIFGSLPSLSITNRYLPQAPLSITPRAFHLKLKSHLFKNSYPYSSDPPPCNSRPKRHPPNSYSAPLTPWQVGSELLLLNYYRYPIDRWSSCKILWSLDRPMYVPVYKWESWEQTCTEIELLVGI